MHYLQQPYSLSQRISSFLKIPLFFFLCALLWIATSTLTLNIFIQYNKKQILNAINKIEPKGRFYYSESIEDRNAINEDKITYGSQYNNIVFIGKNNNGEYCYKLPDRMWYIQYKDSQNEDYLKIGSTNPIEIKSKEEISSYEEIIQILQLAYENKMKDFSSFTQKVLINNSEVQQIIDHSDFVYDKQLYNENIQYIPYSTDYIIVQNAKVVLKDTSDEIELIMRPNVRKILKTKFYITLGIIFLLFFIYCIGKKTMGLIDIRLLILFDIIAFSCAGNIYSFYEDKEERKKSIHLEKRFDTDIREMFPRIDNLARKIKYIKKIEGKAIRNCYNPYQPHLSISTCLNELYSDPDLIDLKDYCEIKSNQFVASIKPTKCPDDENRLQSRTIYQDIVYTANRYIDLSPYDIYSEEDFKRYLQKDDSLKNRLSVLIYDFYNRNKSVLDGFVIY